MLAAGLVGFTANAGRAELLINEIYYDPGGGGLDERDEYIELRGTPLMSLADHYLIFIEGEDNMFGTGSAGVIENIFDLGIADGGGPASIGSNGFLTLRQKDSLYHVAVGTTDLVNAGPDIPPFAAYPGYGTGVDDGDPNTQDNFSTIGASDLPTPPSPVGEGKVENGGWTAMLIHNESGKPPELGTDLDEGNDGLDVPIGQEGWIILDSIGVFNEFNEAEFGRLYAQVNFGAEPTENVEEGALYMSLDFELEYVGRWGNSTGQSLDDWHASNLTDNPGSGSLGVTTAPDGAPDFRQSCKDDPAACHPANDGDPTTPAPDIMPVESSQGVRYGTKLVNTLGAPNYLPGDYNKDGYVTAADYVVWRNSVGQTADEENHHAADGNLDFVVDELDYEFWVDHFGLPGAVSQVAAGQSGAVPELATVQLFGCVLFGLLAASRRCR